MYILADVLWKRAVGPEGAGGGPHQNLVGIEAKPCPSKVLVLLLSPTQLCVQIEFYGAISWESSCKSVIKVWADFYQIKVVLEVPHQLRVNRLEIAKNTKI